VLKQSPKFDNSKVIRPRTSSKRLVGRKRVVKKLAEEAFLKRPRRAVVANGKTQGVPIGARKSSET